MGRPSLHRIKHALSTLSRPIQVVDVLTKALCDAHVPLPTKVAHLFVVSDILHNSTAPVRNASRYRSLLEAVLPDVFESLQVVDVHTASCAPTTMPHQPPSQATYRQQTSRMGQEMLRRHVLRVLRVWRNWFIFTDDLLNGLQATFLRGAAGECRANASLAAELGGLSEDDLRHRAKRNGLSVQVVRRHVVQLMARMPTTAIGHRVGRLPLWNVSCIWITICMGLQMSRQSRSWGDDYLIMCVCVCVRVCTARPFEWSANMLHTVMMRGTLMVIISANIKCWRTTRRWNSP